MVKDDEIWRAVVEYEFRSLKDDGDYILNEGTEWERSGKDYSSVMGPFTSKTSAKRALTRELSDQRNHDRETTIERNADLAERRKQQIAGAPIRYVPEDREYYIYVTDYHIDRVLPSEWTRMEGK